MTDFIPSFKELVDLTDTFNPSIRERFSHEEAAKIGNLPDNIEVYVDKDEFPIPGAHIREGYGGNSDSLYWASGYKDYLVVKKYKPKEGRILDFGCATGRVMRHFIINEDPIYGADLNINNARWCWRSFPKTEVIKSGTTPHLPYEDNFFNYIYALSVFTHIDRDETQWLAEIRRILAPGGRAYITIHGDRAWAERNENGLSARVLAGSEEYVNFENHDTIPDGRFSFSHAERIEAFSNVFHSHSYINDVWGRMLSVSEINVYEHFYQDGVVLTKNKY